MNSTTRNFAVAFAVSLVAISLGAALPHLEPARLVSVASSIDGEARPCWFYAPPSSSGAVPLVVGLHTWSESYTGVKHYRTVLDYAVKNGWAMVGPDFRGPNNNPKACGSELAVCDIVDAVSYAKSRVAVDPKRVYIIGGSGGGHMALLMAGRCPEIFAACVAFCPITDLAKWHAESHCKQKGRSVRYANMLEKVCGGAPDAAPEEYAVRSPITWLGRAKSAGLPVYIATGIHDGHIGSVPTGHSVRAFNALCNATDAISEDDIAYIESNRKVPESLVKPPERDPFYGERLRVHLRLTSGNVRLTLFEGGHSGNYPAGLDFLRRQTKGAPADWTLPATGTGETEVLSR